MLLFVCGTLGAPAHPVCGVLPADPRVGALVPQGGRASYGGGGSTDAASHETRVADIHDAEVNGGRCSPAMLSGASGNAFGSGGEGFSGCNDSGLSTGGSIVFQQWGRPPGFHVLFRTVVPGFPPQVQAVGLEQMRRVDAPVCR